MLKGIHPLLHGELLKQLDAMGHSDAVVLADAHFPAAALTRKVIDMPGIGTPELLAAVITVLPLDDSPALDLMSSADGSVLPVQRELMTSADVDEATTRFVERFEYYDLARESFVIIRTGETRTYANALVRKGVVAG